MADAQADAGSETVVLTTTTAKTVEEPVAGAVPAVETPAETAAKAEVETEAAVNSVAKELDAATVEAVEAAAAAVAASAATAAAATAATAPSDASAAKEPEPVPVKEAEAAPSPAPVVESGLNGHSGAPAPALPTMPQSIDAINDDDDEEDTGEWEADRLFSVPNVGADDYLECKHSWSEGPHDQFKIRSKYYCTKGNKMKGVKEMSSLPGHKLTSVLLIPHDEKLTNVCSHYPLPPRAPGQPKAIIIVFLLPSNRAGEPRLHLLLRFERQFEQDKDVNATDLAIFNEMMDKSTTDDSTFVADRIKILPFIVHGANWVTCKLVNNQPGLICAALETNQFNGPGYAEVDIDIEGFKSGPFSALAKRVLDVVKPRVATLVIDLAFMEQGNDVDELPERIIGVARLMKLNLSTSSPDDPARRAYVPTANGGAAAAGKGKRKKADRKTKR
uniref:Protein ENHANCED DISEASE RESISTANCE 2 C-terminal domain-containing protein n=1 Tax=Chrysotila carterae TaxID=13221 RepID=A0A6S9ZAZ2_CHRCT